MSFRASLIKSCNFVQIPQALHGRPTLSHSFSLTHWPSILLQCIPIPKSPVSYLVVSAFVEDASIAPHYARDFWSNVNPESPSSLPGHQSFPTIPKMQLSCAVPHDLTRSIFCSPTPLFVMYLLVPRNPVNLIPSFSLDSRQPPVPFFLHRDPILPPFFLKSEDFGQCVSLEPFPTPLLPAPDSNCQSPHLPLG